MEINDNIQLINAYLLNAETGIKAQNQEWVIFWLNKIRNETNKSLRILKQKNKNL